MSDAVPALVVLGSTTPFALGVVDGLSDRVRPHVIELDAPAPTMGPFALVQPGSLSAAGLARGWQVSGARSEELEAIFGAADLVVIACHRTVLPARLLGLPTFGVVNLHPSMLPRYRGPVPLFWQLRDGLAEIGITVHRVNAALDAGDILAQQTMRLPEQASEAELSNALGARGAHLLESILPGVLDGTIRPIAQDERVATYQTWPTEREFVLPPACSAVHAVRFLRAMQDRHVPITLAGVGAAPGGSISVARLEAWYKTDFAGSARLWPPASTVWRRPLARRANARVSLPGGELDVVLARSAPD